MPEFLECAGKFGKAFCIDIKNRFYPWLSRKQWGAAWLQYVFMVEIFVQVPIELSTVMCSAASSMEMLLPHNIRRSPFRGLYFLLIYSRGYLFSWSINILFICFFSDNPNICLWQGL